MEHGNMLAIVGSPGSGKTTLAVKLAAEIAKKKKNVVVVCSDPFVPSVPFLLPMDMEQEVSLGALLTSPALTQNEILEACVSVPANEYISLLGYRMGENLMSYPKVTRERAVEFLVCLRHLADYVILDCTSVFEADVFSILAMEMADRVLRVGTSNLRGISYFKSHAGMLEGRADNGKYISAIGNFKTGQEWEAAAGQYGGVGFVFPYVFGRKFGRAFENRESSTYVFFTVSRSLAIFNGENSTSSIPEEKTKKDFSRRLADGSYFFDFFLFNIIYVPLRMRGIRTKRTVSFVFMDIIRDFLGYYPIRWVLSIDRKI